MSEALSESIANLRDHLPSMPEVSMPSLPSVKGRKKPGRRRTGLVLLGLLAAAGSVFTELKRRRAPNAVPPSVYTPPLPKP